MKKYLIIALIVFLICSLTIAVLAVGQHGQAGKSNVAHLYLYEKIPGPILVPPVPWEILEGGAWGKMTYNLSGSTFDFVFNGHGLEVGGDYTLIYYPDKTDNPWPREDIICLGSGIADALGDVHIMGSVDTGDLPTDVDINDGAKIWLVLSADIDCDTCVMSGWDPTEYLFEGELITFTAE